MLRTFKPYKMRTLREMRTLRIKEKFTQNKN